MLTTGVLPRHAIAFLAALVLTLAVALAAIGNSWTATAAAEAPADNEVVADADMTLAGPSWTCRSSGAGDIDLPPIDLPPIESSGPSWG